MITYNGAQCFGASSITGNNVPINALTLIDGSKNTAQITRSNLYLNTASQTDSQRGVKMRLGFSRSTPTLDDFDLIDRIVEDAEEYNVDVNTIVTCTSATIATTAEGSVVYSYTFTNESPDQSFTINEVGLFVSTLGTTSFTALLARSVVPSRTVEPRKTISFTYTISVV